MTAGNRRPTRSTFVAILTFRRIGLDRRGFPRTIFQRCLDPTRASPVYNRGIEYIFQGIRHVEFRCDLRLTFDIFSKIEFRYRAHTLGHTYRINACEYYELTFGRIGIIHIQSRVTRTYTRKRSSRNNVLSTKQLVRTPPVRSAAISLDSVIASGDISRHACCQLPSRVFLVCRRRGLGFVDLIRPTSFQLDRKLEIGVAKRLPRNPRSFPSR